MNLMNYYRKNLKDDRRLRKKLIILSVLWILLWLGWHTFYKNSPVKNEASIMAKKSDGLDLSYLVDFLKTLDAITPYAMQVQMVSISPPLIHLSGLALNEKMVDYWIERLKNFRSFELEEKSLLQRDGKIEFDVNYRDEVSG